MKIATWNVNSISARFERFQGWIEETHPDVVLLQEIKCMTEKFPREAIEDMGYNVLAHGQKT
ncbi:MAG: exodeoxyribonuclease III, partial [Chlamydiia bacterium]|nr:exodeoxyribonuclease III [Chlamydiia bacterium]